MNKTDLKKLILELLEDEDIRNAVGEVIVNAPFNLESHYVPDFVRTTQKADTSALESE